MRAEARETADQTPGGITAFFSADAEPVNDDDLDWLLAVLDWAYAGLAGGRSPIGPRRPALEAALVGCGETQVGLIAYATWGDAPDLPSGESREIEAGAVPPRGDVPHDQRAPARSDP